MTYRRSVQATPREHLLTLPGDEMIPRAEGSLTHAITVQCNRRELWPWLIQMGADRAGWYSYDVLDNGGHRSAEHIVRELQSPPVGAVFPALPTRRDGFILLEGEPTHWLVLGWPAQNGELIVTWSFMLIEIDENSNEAHRAGARQRRVQISWPAEGGWVLGRARGALHHGTQAATRDRPPCRASCRPRSQL